MLSKPNIILFINHRMPHDLNGLLTFIRAHQDKVAFIANMMLYNFFIFQEKGRPTTAAALPLPTRE